MIKAILTSSATTGGEGNINYPYQGDVTVSTSSSSGFTGMNGIVDEVKIYNRELIPTEIQRDYNHDVAILGWDDYDPWGKQMAGRCQTSSGTENKYKFTGKEHDKESNYDYFGARYYDSEIGRWLQVDPLADKYPGWSPYNYCKDNSQRLVDLDGREVFPEEPNDPDENNSQSAYDPSKGPGLDPAHPNLPPKFKWDGKPGSEPGSAEGNYFNPGTGESYHPDLDPAKHNPDDPASKWGPHWDYWPDRGKNTKPTKIDPITGKPLKPREKGNNSNGNSSSPNKTVMKIINETGKAVTVTTVLTGLAYLLILIF